MQVTRTPAAVSATFPRRYRDHHEERLAGIYAVPEFPFLDEGPEGKENDVWAIKAVVIMLIPQRPYDHFEETDPVVGTLRWKTKEYNRWMGIIARHLVPETVAETGPE